VERAVNEGSILRTHVLRPTLSDRQRPAGTGTRAATASSVTVEVAPYRRLTRAAARDVRAAVERYGRFLLRPAGLSMPGKGTE
jgi:hypothetical protein